MKRVLTFELTGEEAMNIVADHIAAKNLKTGATYSGTVSFDRDLRTVTVTLKTEAG